MAFRKIVESCLAEYDFRAPFWTYTKGSGLLKKMYHLAECIDSRFYPLPHHCHCEKCRTTAWRGWMHFDGARIDAMDPADRRTKVSHERFISYVAVHNTLTSRRLDDWVLHLGAISPHYMISHDTLWSMVGRRDRCVPFEASVFGWSHPRRSGEHREYAIPDHARSWWQLLTARPAHHPSGTYSAVEVGVFRAECHLAMRRLALLTTTKLALIGIDNYNDQPPANYLASGDKRPAASAWRRRSWRTTAEAVMGPLLTVADWQQYGYRGIVGAHDSIFLDAAHDRESVAADILRAWPLIHPGGVLCGHDYHHRRYRGVTEAVDAWAGELGLPVESLPGSVWGVRKPLD